MEATINIDDRKTFQSLVQFLRSLNIDVATKKEKDLQKSIKKKNNNITNFYQLIDKYNKIDEPELDINTIINDRKLQIQREFNFD